MPLCLVALQVDARTIFRCERDGVVSLASAPEPGSQCVGHEVDDEAAALPNLWGALGLVRGTLYERQQDGRAVYSTRKLPGSVKVLDFTARTPAPAGGSVPASRVESPQLNRHAEQFRRAAKASGIDDAWLRAVAHAESGFDPAAISTKGALGVMQLMPETAREYGVLDPFSSAQSINAGARHLKVLLQHYRGDLTLAAAAYNAGVGAVTRHGGVPPFSETRAYVARVAALHRIYRQALDAAGAN